MLRMAAPGTSTACTRRSFLQIGASSVLGLSWPALLQARASSAGGYLQPKIRSVILLWLWGGPSHLDTFDPKPDAPAEYRGPFAAIPTRVTGVRVCELFPRVASSADRLLIVRSLHTFSNDHGVAGTIGLTGSHSGAVNLGGAMLAGSVRPALGAMVARAQKRHLAVPPYLVLGGRLHQGKKTIVGEGGGPLGAQYDPFRVIMDAASGPRLQALELPAELTLDRLDQRHQLYTQLDRLERQVAAWAQSSSLDAYRAQAFSMLLAPQARRVFDLSTEREALRDAYGRTRFGQACLLARRLVEHGVPFVQVNWSDHVEAEEDAGDGGWDLHYRNFQILQDRHATIFDCAFATLIADLDRRGLLSSTLVLALGEFGRTPRINNKAGRDHWEHCYCALLAGAGIKVGTTYGESDQRAEHPRSHPCTPADLIATVQHLVGISRDQATLLNIAVDGRVLDEILD
mgnify:CR=1 FL=1